MKVEYIHHSGCTVETEDYFLVFDYYKGDINLKTKIPLYFLAIATRTTLIRKYLSGRRSSRI